ncbi:hypothetical protein Tamer19_22470 [Cupriavidus sp. TA19]|nr:hypothetical protein Tamer19_22470 [Cupriavidus sp. TA19]
MSETGMHFVGILYRRPLNESGCTARLKSTFGATEHTSWFQRRKPDRNTTGVEKRANFEESWELASVVRAVAIQRLAQRAIEHPGISQAVDVAIGMMLLNTPANPAEGASSGIVSLG